MSEGRLNRLALAALLGAAALPAQAAGEELRDPLRPPGWGETEKEDESAPRFDASAWRLRSTLVASGRRVAIINGRHVAVGDRVGGAEVLDISAGRATLDYRGRRFTIRRRVEPVRFETRNGGRRE